MASTPEPLSLCWLGRIDFDRALALQLERRETLIEDDTTPDQERVYLCEHPPTIAMGVRADASHVLWSESELDSAGMVVCDTPRGGEATLHAPGQLVVYPVMAIGRRIRAHIEHLAGSARELCEAHGVQDLKFQWEHPGLWRGRDKIASVGIHIRRGVSVQGLSLNIDVDPSLFGALVSCGMDDVRMVSLAGQPEVSAAPTVGEAARIFGELFCQRLGRVPQWVAGDG